MVEIEKTEYTVREPGKPSNKCPGVESTFTERAGRRRGQPIPQIMGIALSLLLAGCSFQQTIAEHSIDYNRTVAQSADAQVLLNILRARDRQPMHFTAISEFNASLKQSSTGTLGLTLPFGGDADSEFTLSPQLQLSQESNPTFKVTVLETAKDFSSATLTPISLADVKLFIDQGWPLALLLYLIVESGEVVVTDPDPVRPETPPGGTDITPNRAPTNEPERRFGFGDFPELKDSCKTIGERIENDPEDPKQMKCFREIVRYLSGYRKTGSSGSCKQSMTAPLREHRVQIIETFSARFVGPKLADKDLKDVEKLVELSEKGFSLVADGKDYRLCEASKATHFCVEAVDQCSATRKALDACNELIKSSNVSMKSKESDNAKDESPQNKTTQHREQSIDAGKEILNLELEVEFATSDTETKVQEVNVQFTAQLRSLQGMLYYAGELMRVGDPNLALVPRSGCAKKDDDETLTSDRKQEPLLWSKPLLKVESGKPAKDAAVIVKHQGESFWIENRDENSRSLSVLAFLTQVQALFQSRADIPTSQTVFSID
ncbi:hypothetical protein [Pelagibius sp.]|uniref:hypothetical protein n=1 Tax=Pelagibius sp. TaxID=1931238 RepID=UPI002626E724|nr:hypothetical protein [Pelagibius sp.]